MKLIAYHGGKLNKIREGHLYFTNKIETARLYGNENSDDFKVYECELTFKNPLIFEYGDDYDEYMQSMESWETPLEEGYDAIICEEDPKYYVALKPVEQVKILKIVEELTETMQTISKVNIYKELVSEGEDFTGGLADLFNNYFIDWLEFVDEPMNTDELCDYILEHPKETENTLEKVINNIANTIEKEIKNKIGKTIYRCISSDKDVNGFIKDLESFGCGACWAEYFEQANDYYGNSEEGYYIISGILTEDNLNLKTTIKQRILYDYEKEIRLKGNTKVFITEIRDANGKRYEVNKEMNTGIKYTKNYESLNEMLKMGKGFTTESASEVANLLKKKSKEYRILYDKNINLYMIGDADSVTHWDMLQAAYKDAYYYNMENFINELGTFENYIEVGQDGGWDEDDNEIEPYLWYIIYTPNNEWDLGTDGYNKKYDYDFGHILTRGCDLSEIELWQYLGVPKNTETLNENIFIKLNRLLESSLG